MIHHSRRVLVSLLSLSLLLGTTGLSAQKPKRAGKKAEVHEVQKSGRYLFAKSPKRIKMKLGKRLEADAVMRKTDFFGKPAIACQVDVHNKAKVKMYVSLHLAFFDKAGKLVGCTSQNMDFDPGDRTAIAGALVRAPEAAMDTIHSYQLRFWESSEKL